MNEFEKYPALAKWMEGLANSDIEGMSLIEWDRFCADLNAALIEAAKK